MVLGLQGYGIPYQVWTIPSDGGALPDLTSSPTVGNYGAIVVYVVSSPVRKLLTVLSMSELSTTEGTGQSHSALKQAQWQQLYDYQTTFGVRMVRIGVYPGSDFGKLSWSNLMWPLVEHQTGTTVAASGDQAGEFATVALTNASAFATANLKTGAPMPMNGMVYWPAKITDAQSTWEFATFTSTKSGSPKLATAAVINRKTSGTAFREQMVFFLPWAIKWSPTSNYLQHAYIHWMTRGLYAGFRRIYFSTQIDDVHLATELYEPQGSFYRITPSDLDNHVRWMADLNARLPAGSNYIMELAHNGFGNVANATNGATQSSVSKLCPRDNYVNLRQPAAQKDPGIEYAKPAGVGSDLWPAAPTTFHSTTDCMELDPLMKWFRSGNNKDSFAHVSHTYTHEELNQATYQDAKKEIAFNMDWLKTSGLSGASRFSSQGLIPPAITGLHNSDVIQGWVENGIKYVVGDNTRPALLNNQSSFWPLSSIPGSSSAQSVQIIPRWATNIYYNCDLPTCDANQWAKSMGKGTWTFAELLEDAKKTNSLNLLGLHHDPFMFHQANMRTSGPAITVNGISGSYSMLMAWVETVLQEMQRLTTWPIITKTHDEIAKNFIARQARDQCNYELVYMYDDSGETISGVTLSSRDNSCAEPIPVTFPSPVVDVVGGTTEQVRYLGALNLPGLLDYWYGLIKKL